MLTLTPLLEMIYVALLFVLVALYRPRLSVAWAAPILMWGTFPTAPLRVAHVLVVVALTGYLAYTGWELHPKPRTRVPDDPAPA